MDVTSKGSDKTPGNDMCQALLRGLLREAEKGEMTHLAVVFASHPDKYFSRTVGSILYQGEIANLLDGLAKRLREKDEERRSKYDPSVSADHVTFSTQAHNINYDFVPWLVGAEMHRIRHGAPGPLKVAFYDAGQQLEIPEVQRTMLRNVVGPLVQAIGGVIGPNKFGRGDFPIGYTEVVEAARNGEKVPRFRAPDLARGAVDALLDGLPAPVTITLREAAYYPQRNSNLEAWLKFASDLVKKGEQVFFVRDTARMNEDLPGFVTLPIASENLSIRTALYERAKANLFVSNGPATINWHLDTPFLMFIETDPDDQGNYEPAKPHWWPAFHGIHIGEQFPWFNARQHIVWQSDSYANLSAAWEEHFTSAARNAAA